MALKRIKYVSIHADDDENSALVAMSLASFTVAGARCFDPNEERRLKTIIDAGGREVSHCDVFVTAFYSI